MDNPTQPLIYDSHATRLLWLALNAGHRQQLCDALNLDADPNATINGVKPLEKLTTFTNTDDEGAAALALVLSGAQLPNDVAALSEKVGRALRHVAMDCGAEPARVTMGMHNLPAALYPAYLQAVEDAGNAIWPVHRPHDRRRRHGKATAALWRALEIGDLEMLESALDQNAHPRAHNPAGLLPIQALDRFAPDEGALAALLLAMTGDKFDEGDDEHVHRRIQLGLLFTGLHCGGPNAEATVGMHQLPPALYSTYLSMVERYNGLDAGLADTGDIESPQPIRQHLTHPMV